MSDASAVAGDRRNFLPDAFVARARQRLLAEPHALALDPDYLPERGDDHVNELLPAAADAAAARPAAVLVPAVARALGVTLLLTLRAQHLRDHSGQIAFPGGKIDAGDATPLAAALREAQEEIGLSPDRVTPIGYLDTYLTTTGYRIVPVVGLVEPGAVLSVDTREVDEIFEVPLEFLMDPQNHQRHTRPFRGMSRRYYAMPFGERYIWGVTAGIIRNLYERLFS
jgi:8-oxo-dGTP pyrophosphatase MutT (NUDIX family)